MPEQLSFTMPYEGEELLGSPGTLNVTMSVDGGAITSVAGTLNGQELKGSLHFTAGGGGPCIVCGPPPLPCRPVVPCPDP